MYSFGYCHIFLPSTDGVDGQQFQPIHTSRDDGWKNRQKHAER
jgi:hypothetical protein